MHACPRNAYQPWGNDARKGALPHPWRAEEQEASNGCRDHASTGGREEQRARRQMAGWRRPWRSADPAGMNHDGGGGRGGGGSCLSRASFRGSGTSPRG